MRALLGWRLVAGRDFLDESSLQRLFLIAREIFGIDTAVVPVSIEVSPGTINASKVALLSAHNVQRLSIGVQSFVDSEVNAVGRSQNSETVGKAIGLIKAAEIPVLNIDLIYGLSGQTEESWLFSLEAAVQYEPEEIYIYPLYVVH